MRHINLYWLIDWKDRETVYTEETADLKEVSLTHWQLNWQTFSILKFALHYIVMCRIFQLHTKSGHLCHDKQVNTRKEEWKKLNALNFRDFCERYADSKIWGTSDRCAYSVNFKGVLKICWFLKFQGLQACFHWNPQKDFLLLLSGNNNNDNNNNNVW